MKTETKSDDFEIFDYFAVIQPSQSVCPLGFVFPQYTIRQSLIMNCVIVQVKFNKSNDF